MSATPRFGRILSALVTPFAEDGSVNTAVAADLARRLVAEGHEGFVVCGTTGESPTLSHAEHERVVELCIEAAAGRVPVIAGAGSNSTAEALAFTAHAKKAGASKVFHDAKNS